ncbi:hypothetical protein KKF81_01360 [Candidatus Micrarchaeota archaeon]|nr:hypothetical protein [Candidatus Micrarchaeota archaeon]MBU1165568.1 hypothetical protein [Candidatus Micrarchaeota archaeon]MBU1887378.1 hypothetical protein [Candidatus Micrarchaeota archaeon]
MYRVYECENSKKAELMKILETDPYNNDSFARAGYKIKEGAVLEEDKNHTYVYISASDDFVKKADDLLKEIAKPTAKEVEARIVAKIKEEEEQAESGLGSIFG